MAKSKKMIGAEEYFDISGQVLSQRQALGLGAKIHVRPKGFETEITLYEPMWPLNFIPMVMLGSSGESDKKWANEKPISKVMLIGQDLLTKEIRSLPAFDVDYIRIEPIDGDAAKKVMKNFDKYVDFGEDAKKAGMPPLSFDIPPKGDDVYGGITESDFEEYKKRFEFDGREYTVLGTTFTTWRDGSITSATTGKLAEPIPEGEAILDAFAFSLYKNVRMYYALAQYMLYMDNLLKKSVKSMYDIADKDYKDFSCKWDSEQNGDDEEKMDKTIQFIQPFSKDMDKDEQQEMAADIYKDFTVEVKKVSPEPVTEEDVKIYTVLRPFFFWNGHADVEYQSNVKTPIKKGGNLVPKPPMAYQLGKMKLKNYITKYKDIDIPKIADDDADSMAKTMLQVSTWKIMATIAVNLLKGIKNIVGLTARKKASLKTATEWKVSSEIANTELLQHMLSVVEQYDKFVAKH